MRLSSIFKFRESEPETVKPFLDHLEDLRWVIVKMGISLALAMFLAFLFRAQLVHILQGPLNRVDPNLLKRLVSLGVADSMTISFQLAFYAGVVIAFPFLIYFAGEFILPALTPQEKKAMLPGVGIGFGLFLLGVILGYVFVLPSTLRFFFRDAQNLDWTPTWTVRDYFSFVTQLCVGFGIAFELPVIVLILVRLGILSVAMLRRTRAYAFVLVFVAAAFLAPTPDAVSMTLMGAPMYLLYEVCILVAGFMERKRKRDEALRSEA
ncbi:MAG: twin-arginine translocase subunit TatC [Verrucomicrobia bacterium]|nr:twin-arginine translocase subunit TatC [Verrucomicrobiota bacterium]MBV9671338.1 twin-arginine translocase subunit TatC [Verrucomicrobiota bacterium]